ncbi:MAG: 3-hydroxyacyl-CoA dehydrogenase family protein [Saprospiraceae bacterium]|nr:3-hydroxyacyl-CoA dehydrogenase family protein [Saprospiraceae bacterium]
MNYADKFENVTVLGAAGKMGSGILLLTACEMADLSLNPENKGKQFVLNAMDVSNAGLAGLLQYLKVQVTKIAEKKTVALRKMYEDRADLIENGHIIEQYIFDVLSLVRPITRLEPAYESTLIFEAIKEDPALKVKIFSQIDQNNNKSPWFFTNTSSIPIGKLDKDANLGGRVLGVHFYNPPAVQKLVEVIKGEGALPEVEEFALAYIKSLRKIAVPSNDFAGFIGNGHFMRDALYGINEALKLAVDMPMVEAIYIMNKISQDYLVRPMGIFQLIDYVGVDVCSYIMSVMNPYLADEDLHSPVLDKMIELGVYGGQYSSGAQKDGFLKYEKGRPVAIYDMDKKEYAPTADFAAKCDALLGDLPKSYVPWKAANFNRAKNEILANYFAELNTMETMGAQLAKAYNKRSNEIGKKLVADKVANNDDDVNTVMLTGFFHAYGPINEYLK